MSSSVAFLQRWRAVRDAIRTLVTENDAIIDTEYPGQEPIIKSYLLNFMRGYGREDLNKSSFIFKQIGKASPAHKVAHDAFTGKTTAKELSAKELIDLVN